MAEKLEVNGIKVELEKDKLADMRFITMMGDIESESLSQEEKMIVQSELLNFVFGRVQRNRIQDEIAKKNDGKLTNEAFSAWWIAFLKTANAKN